MPKRDTWGWQSLDSALRGERTTVSSERAAEILRRGNNACQHEHDYVAIKRVMTPGEYAFVAAFAKENGVEFGAALRKLAAVEKTVED